jgi:predicted permease
MPNNTSDTGNENFVYGINVYNRLREDKSVFSDLIAYVPLSFNKTAVRFGTMPEEVNADEVSGNFFSALGVAMAAGQPFAAADEAKHSQVAVISYGYWNRRLHHDPGVIGKTLYIKGVPFTIVGVAASHFYGVESGGVSTDVWVPLQNNRELNAWGIPANSKQTLYGSPNWWTLMLMARLKPGLTPQQALIQVNPVFARAAYETNSKNVPGTGPKLELQMILARGLGTASSQYQDPLRVLMGMVALVLLIACVNIVMLLVAKNSMREREFALRTALGARRARLFRQLVTESVLLVAAGALLGWYFAVQATHLLADWSHIEISLAPDKTVLLFTLAVSVAAALLFGLAPLRIAAKAPVGMVLRSGGAQTTASRSRVLSGKILIALQMAFCVVLLFGAGLLVRTLRNYQDVNLGMKAQSVLAFGVHPIGQLSHQESTAFYENLIERLGRIPGVESVTLALNRPGTGWSDNNGLTIDGRSIQSDELRSNIVGSDFFKTLGIPVIVGRDISDADTDGSQRIAVVNQTLVDRYLKETSPIGHTIGYLQHLYTIVGVVRDSKYTGVDEESMPMAWYSYRQFDAAFPMDVEVRVSGNPLNVLPAVRRVVRDMDPNIPLDDPQVLSAVFAQTYLMPTLFARLAVFFAALAALLVAVGLYGALSYRVGRRTAEIGVRMALGAARRQVLWMVLRDSLWLVLAGLVIGLPLAWFGARLMASMLYKLSAHDPLSFVLAGAGVLIVSLLAALIPARRAASVEPMQALRME